MYRSKMRVAVVGGGSNGLISAYELARGGVDVVLYEKEDHLGGRHAKSVTFDGIDLHLGFMQFDQIASASMMEFFESIGLEMEPCNMSFGVSLDKGKGCEWGTRNGLSSLFAQKKNMANPYFWQMIKEMNKFKRDVMGYLESVENNCDRNQSLGEFINSGGYSELFENAFLIPVCCSICPCSPEQAKAFSAYSLLSFWRNHHLLQLFGIPQWSSMRLGSHKFVYKVREELEKRSCLIKTGCEVISVSTDDEGSVIIVDQSSKEKYDGCIITTSAPDTMMLLGTHATSDERKVLGAFQYVQSEFYLHKDSSLMPLNLAAWSSWNFLATKDNRVYTTYWLNELQALGETKIPYLVTLNPPQTPANILLKSSISHPVPSVRASKASLELYKIQGKRGIWFCGTYQGFGFHDDGLKVGLSSVYGVLKSSCEHVTIPKSIEPSWTETGARLIVERFLKTFIATGCLIILEGGSIFTFQGTVETCSLRVVIRIHDPQFYWKVATRGDIGLADAYIDGDYSFTDANFGLLHLIMILVVNEDLNASVSRPLKKRTRGWWSPLLSSAVFTSAKYFLAHVSRRNTLTQARRNISRHYDLSNELFSLFLDETMTYSSALFKADGEDLTVAQLRKMSTLIEKARISKEHHILDIGSGWGSFSIEVVKRTGCKCTGITLSEEQLKYAEMKVKEAGLQDHIKFLLCDYRQLPDTCKFDRIMSCEMIEHVGHEYIDEFFRCCDTALAENGIFVLQFIAFPDGLYDKYRRSSGFVREYIFPGGNLPSLSRVISAMVNASSLCVEHLENIGTHYYQTLRYWRKNFLENESKIKDLGFDQKFIRTWEYYFDYCAAAFKSCQLRDYQVVFSRPGNVALLGDPYKGIPSNCLLMDR